MSDGPLIEAGSLAARLGDPRLVVVDCRFDLLEPAAGRKAYEAGHIPGARYADLDRDLARAPGREDGRHPLPSPTAFAATLGRWGIGRHTEVVVYDEGGGAIAARLWWLLGWLGHERRSVLDGGFGAWTRAGLAVERTLPRWEPTIYPVPDQVADEEVVTSAEIAAGERRGQRLVDVRAAPRYRGEQEPIDPVAGHVPGAVSWPFSNALESDGRFRPTSELRADLAKVLDGREASNVIAMCGSGVTACHLLLAMATAGLTGGKLYAGSWSEWIRDPSRPVAIGADP